MKKTQRAQRTDGEATRARILEEAGELLAAIGFAETTNKMIAVQAEVDLASINYHFGSRSGLYQAVLIEAHRRLVNIDALDRLAASELLPHEKLRKLIEFLIDGTAAHQFWPLRVLGREFMSPSSHLQVLEDSEIAPKFAVIRQILSQITSIPIDDPALLRCMVSVAAPCIVLLVVGRGPTAFGDQILNVQKTALIDHLYDFSMGGLRAIALDFDAKG